MILLREVLREAWRNTAAGVSRPLISGVLFTLLVGGVAGAQVLSVVRVNQEAAAWRASGASIQVLDAAGKVDGARCDSLAGLPGITGAGAVRAGVDVRLAALPSTTVSTLEVSPGMRGLLGVRPAGKAPGVWMSSDLAANLGLLKVDRTSVAKAGGGSVPLEGIYRYEEDGRRPILAYTMLSQVPAVGVFDSCWVEVWPESAALDQLQTYPFMGSAAGGQDPPKIQQLNASKGVSFEASSRLASLSPWLLTTAGATLSAALGFGLIRMRRLELAGALHAGVDRVSLTLQTGVEFVLWTAAPLTFLVVGLWVASTLGNPEPPWPAYARGLSILVVSWSAAMLATTLTAGMLKESQLFRYFKNR